MITTQDQKWLDALILELRLRDVSGSGIGDTVASVKEYLADSGEGAQEAFGTPAGYAASLDLSASVVETSLKGTIARSVLGVVAFVVFTQAISPWAAGELLGLGAAQLAWLAVPAILVVGLPMFLGALMRRFWLFMVLFAAAVAAGILAAFSAPRDPASSWLSLDPAVVLVAAAAVMIALSVMGTIDAMNVENDTIREPLETPGTASKNRTTSRIAGILAAWIFPVFAAIFLGLGVTVFAF
ncbi:hypothetical protein [Paeniglutamicibacter sp.]|uniref:hypothetical protein n=1 Tax=Paeniglutamicibacter sp. TaxID=1934391 RepID=UPI00398A117F